MSKKTNGVNNFKIGSTNKLKGIINKFKKTDKLTPENIKKTFSDKFEKLRNNATLIIFSLLTVVIILFFYYNSKGYKVNKSLTNMAKYKLYVITGSELNKPDNRTKKLCDFYVSCAYKPYMVNNQFFGYCSLDVMKAVLFSGVRCVYIDVFNSAMTSDAYPVINNGYMEGEWKFAFNSIDFKDVCKLIKKIVFSSGYVNNSTDPFILCLNLKTNGNYKCLNKVKKILYDVFGNKLLDNTYTYSSKYVMTEPIKDLMGKLIVFSSGGFENSDLEELINYSWDKEGLKKISYESIDIKSTNNSVVKLDNNELKNYNMNGITLVTPNENSIFTYNYDPNYGWDSGCQLVFFNFQKMDENMSTYIEKFQNLSFIKKPDNMISGSKKPEIKLKVNKEIRNDSEMPKEPLSCPEKPSEDYESMLGDDMLFYKNKNSNDLGLCYMLSNRNHSCNCNDIHGDTCDKSLWFEYNMRRGTNRDDDEKLCCSTRRINDPSVKNHGTSTNTDTKHFLSIKTNSEGSSLTGGADYQHIKLSSGISNFETSNDSDFSSKLVKRPVTTNQDLENKKVCLLNVNNNRRELCPTGWQFSGQLDSDTYNNQNIKLCCRDL
jgi:hypothetical protein